MDSTAPARPLALSRWLFAVAALVFAMVVVGGITRLTESGLSITVVPMQCTRHRPERPMANRSSRLVWIVKAFMARG